MLASIWALCVTLGVDPGVCKLSRSFLFGHFWVQQIPLVAPPSCVAATHPLTTVILPKMSCAELEARPPCSASSQKSHRLRGQWGLSGRALATVVPQGLSCELWQCSQLPFNLVVTSSRKSSLITSAAITTPPPPGAKKPANSKTSSETGT